MELTMITGFGTTGFEIARPTPGGAPRETASATRRPWSGTATRGDRPAHQPLPTLDVDPARS